MDDDIDMVLQARIQKRIDELLEIRQKIVDNANAQIDRVNVAIGELEAILKGEDLETEQVVPEGEDNS